MSGGLLKFSGVNRGDERAGAARLKLQQLPDVGQRWAFGIGPWALGLQH